MGEWAVVKTLAVIARKIIDGTRSSQGIETKATLMTLFETWKLQGKRFLETCRRMLLATVSMPRITSG